MINKSKRSVAFSSIELNFEQSLKFPIVWAVGTSWKKMCLRDWYAHKKEFEEGDAPFYGSGALRCAKDMDPKIHKVRKNKQKQVSSDLFRDLDV